MRILIDIRHLADRQKTGVGEYTRELARALFETDRENDYELFSSGTRRPGWDDLGGSAKRTHLGVPNKLLKATTYLAGWPCLDRMAAQKPDLLFFPNLNFSATTPGIPYVLTVHDLSWKIFPDFFSRRMRAWHRGTRPGRLIRNAAAIIVPSYATREDVRRFFDVPEERIRVIPHGVRPEFAPEPAAEDSEVRERYALPERFALFVGTLEPRKNVAGLVRAIEDYRARTGDDLHLVLAGGWGWKSKEIRNLLLPPTPHLHRLDYVPDADLPALYRAAEFFAWPSVYEGFGLPVLEAMASGTPVITSHTSSLPELTGPAAIHVDPYNPVDLTVALEQLRSSPALRDRLRTAGIARAGQFSWNESARGTLEAFRSVA